MARGTRSDTEGLPAISVLGEGVDADGSRGNADARAGSGARAGPSIRARSAMGAVGGALQPPRGVDGSSVGSGAASSREGVLNAGSRGIRGAPLLPSVGEDAWEGGAWTAGGVSQWQVAEEDGGGGARWGRSSDGWARGGEAVDLAIGADARGGAGRAVRGRGAGQLARGSAASTGRGGRGGDRRHGVGRRSYGYARSSEGGQRGSRGWEQSGRPSSHEQVRRMDKWQSRMGAQGTCHVDAMMSSTCGSLALHRAQHDPQVVPCRTRSLSPRGPRIQRCSRPRGTPGHREAPGVPRALSQ